MKLNKVLKKRNNKMPSNLKSSQLSVEAYANDEFPINEFQQLVNETKYLMDKLQSLFFRIGEQSFIDG